MALPRRLTAFRRARAALAAVSLTLLALTIMLLAPVAGRAALVNVGSSLSQPATLNTAENLSYPGTDTALYGGGSLHTYHFGADMALWNTSVAGRDAAMPADGQAVRIRLEGCAQPAASGPSPLTQIHFQALSPLGDGGARVDLSSQPFDIPVCGHGGASGSTITTFEPVNLCVNRGDYVAFNNEGGWVPHVYQSGVPYRVLAPVAGSSFDSFIRGNGTNNGAALSALDSTDMDGFAANRGAELMMQVVLGTGPDARYVCPGGSKDAPVVLSALSVHPQTAGVGPKRVVAVTIYCRPQPGCTGTASLTVGTRHVSMGTTGFALQGNHSTSVTIHVSQKLLALARKAHGHRLSATLTASMGTTTVTQTIAVTLNHAR
jgi:hypothetical protein